MISINRLPPPLCILSLFALLNFRCLTAAKCNLDDETGLLAFKSAISADPSGMLTSWKPGTDCCAWAGITCLGAPANNRVTSLSLYGDPNKPNHFLSGTISPSLSKLRYLDGIYFVDLGNLSGAFPSLLFSLPNILFVYIENNRLSGPLPGNIDNLARLNSLSLAGNQFSGQIPSSISRLTHLTQLELGGNLLTGVIPNGIRQLKNLSFLSLERNQLSGSIPDFFKSFTSLRVLRLSHNGFSGKIPPTISSLAPNLAYLELGHNALTGQIPSFLGSFHALDTLDLSWNLLAGTVPRSFENLTKIFNLDLSHNLLVDPFPKMEVKGIESLDLSYNNFHLIEIPKWATLSTIIYSLKLAKCGIKMNLDDWNPKETYFYDYIDLSDNEISGSPIGLLNRTDYLVEFSASGNRLKFNFESMRFVKTLKKLNLSRNLVFGRVPKDISGLEELNVSYNHLCGPLPASKFPVTAFVGNDCLCGAPLPSCKRVRRQ